MTTSRCARRLLPALLVLWAWAAVQPAHANHFILPCGNDCSVQWVPAPAMHEGRVFHTATLLQDGTVLVTGGENGSPLLGTERYDPAAGIWRITAFMSTARASHTATLLADGRVLVAG